MKNDISQSLGLDLDNVNVYAEVYQNIPLSSRDKAIFTFSEFEPRQKLNQSQVLFDNLMGYISSISMCLQSFITIFHSVQEIAPLSLFQNLELAKPPRPMKNVIMQPLGLDRLRNSLSKDSTQFKRKGHFHFFRIWRSAKPRTMIDVILQFLELDLVNINASAKFYQTIPNGLGVQFHCFQI